jgi:predicted NUDIX family phosphoesterase
MTDRARELVLGLPRERVIGDAPWQGIRVDRLEAALAMIRTEGVYRPRVEAEDDPGWKQVIPYLLMRDGQRLFLMQRSQAGADRRLHDLYSLGIGGHLNPEDGDVLEGLRREFHEEMVADWEPQPRLVGLLNDDDTPVGQVHVGVVFEADAAGRPLGIREQDKLNGKFVTIADVLPVYDSLETWSRFLYDWLTGPAGRPGDLA